MMDETDLNRNVMNRWRDGKCVKEWCRNLSGMNRWNGLNE